MAISKTQKYWTYSEHNFSYYFKYSTIAYVKAGGFSYAHCKSDAPESMTLSVGTFCSELLQELYGNK